MEDEPLIHVLVVDDDILQRKIYEKMLLRYGGFKVTTAESAEKAMQLLGMTLGEQNTEVLSAINESKIDIVLTDFCMPEKDGLDLLKAVKGNEILKSIPVVLMSSENVPDRICSCEDAGAEKFFIKPLRQDDIQQLIGYVKLARAAVPDVEMKRKASSDLGTESSSTEKVGTKRKASLDLVKESRGAERRTHLAGVAVA